jgi:hypothetical protein
LTKNFAKKTFSFWCNYQHITVSASGVYSKKYFVTGYVFSSFQLLCASVYLRGVPAKETVEIAPSAGQKKDSRHSNLEKLNHLNCYKSTILFFRCKSFTDSDIIDSIGIGSNQTILFIVLHRLFYIQKSTKV